MDIVPAQRSSSSDFERSSNTTRPDACDRCRLTSCSALHDYSASSCPYNICQECGELEDLDAQITKIHNRLIDLSNKRRDLKNRINRRHDRLALHLPIEIVSYIFGFIADESLRSVVALGVVCRRWREIVLDTPQLWTKITINLFGAEAASFSKVILGYWCNRSYGLPLSFKLEVDPWASSDLPQATMNILQLLRSQAHRWKDVVLKIRRASPTLDVLLMGLEDSVIVDSLTIHISDFSPQTVNKITMKYPFSPERLDLYNVPLSQIPMEWERLTHLEAWHIGADALIHIFEHAYNLRCCLLSTIREDAGHYPIPASPIANTSIKELAIGDSGRALDMGLLLSLLTLPFLETLRYHLIDDRDDNGEEMGAIRLRAFLERSHPPLRVFFVYHYPWPPQSISIHWCRFLPSITSLELASSTIKGMWDLLELLGPRGRPQALPCLQELCLFEVEIEPEYMFLDLWIGLAELFPDPESNKDTPLVTVRPLKTVIIRTRVRSWDLEQEIMSKTTHARLHAIQQSGVALHVFDANSVDVLGPEIELTFEDTEDELNNEGSSETGTEEGVPVDGD